MEEWSFWNLLTDDVQGMCEVYRGLAPFPWRQILKFIPCVTYDFCALAVSMIRIFLFSKVNSLYESQCRLSLTFLILVLVHQCKGMGIFCTRQPRNALRSSTSDVASEEMW
jgi:hypothetical protein